VAKGDTVESGTVILVMEAMKMEHTVTSPCDGSVKSIDTGTGDTVDRGAVLADIALMDEA